MLETGQEQRDVQSPLWFKIRQLSPHWYALHLRLFEKGMVKFIFF